MATVVVSPASGADGANSKRRVGVALAAVVNTTLGSCDVIDIGDYLTLAVKPSASITTLAVYASDLVGGTYVLVDSIGTNGVVTVVASKWNILDPTKMPFRFIKLIPSTNGTVDVIGKT